MHAYNAAKTPLQGTQKHKAESSKHHPSEGGNRWYARQQQGSQVPLRQIQPTAYNHNLSFLTLCSESGSKNTPLRHNSKTEAHVHT